MSTTKISPKTRERLEKWLDEELASPPGLGEGRNNFIVRLAPRMMELGWERDNIFEAFEQAFGSDDVLGKEDEIYAAIDSSAKYVQAEVTTRTLKEMSEAKAATTAKLQAAKKILKVIMQGQQWTEADIKKAGNLQAMTPKLQSELFIGSMFKADDVVWLGDTWHSGRGQFKKGRQRGKDYDHSNHFRTVRDWLSKPLPRAWEFISHCTFLPGSYSRNNQSVAQRKYMVVESDKLGRDEIGAIFSYLHCEMKCHLRAVVYSGGKSLHGWFDWQHDNELPDLIAFLEGLECDPAVLRASQPVRLPGVVRESSGKVQTLLYLDPPTV